MSTGRLEYRYLDGDPTVVEQVEAWIDAELGATHFLRRHEHADLRQQVHQKLIGSLRAGRFRGEATLRTYVARITRYTAIDQLRRRRFEPGDREPEPPPRPDAVRRLELRERMALLEIALSSCPVQWRELLELVVVHSLPYREVSERLGIPVGTVKSRMAACRSYLRDALNRE